ncbi:MAG: hypothetical protein L3K03_03800 [Thermoplasmata archaeon]|nr:hypothetical protein [Thermoplasmata archaeon]
MNAAGAPSPRRFFVFAAAVGLAFIAISGVGATFLGVQNSFSVQDAVTAAENVLGSATTATPAPGVTSAPALSLGIAADPHSICAFDQQTCSAGAGESRVTLTAQASSAATKSWPAVQIAFVLDTGSYDGDYDPTDNWPGIDPCQLAAPNVGPLCEESNGLPFFTTNAQQIATAIGDANPNSQVSFALVDFHATYDHVWDDGDAPDQYHVDISNFVPANQFGSAVQSTFVATQLQGAWLIHPGEGRGYIETENGLDDSFLHSDSITALYGAIIGSGLTWSEGTHHVIVLMGDGAPRAPGYQQNYCISPSAFNEYGNYQTGAGCYSGTCEPSFSFGSVSSPPCEGWTTSQDGNASHSIAGLTKTSPTCTDSVGGSCTVDVINYYDGITDPYSHAWPTQYDSLGGGPGGAMTLQNSERQLEAGCDLAEATGGSWDGPSFFQCSDGQSGNLNYVPIGSPFAPNTQNPSLMNALRQISFGPVVSSLAATGTGVPLFSYVSFGSIHLAPNPQFQTVCTLSTGQLWGGGNKCPATPVNLTSPSGVHYWGWNWSNNASQNKLYIGDSWSVSFWVVATGPPYELVPVDACITEECNFGGSTSVGGVYSSATYLPASNLSVVTESFPLGSVNVIASASPAPPPTAPPAAPVPPPGIPVASPTPISVQSPVGVSAQIGIGEVAFQATAVGFLVGAAVRVSQRNRPMAVVNLAGKPKHIRSAFDSESGLGSGAGVGRFE